MKIIILDDYLTENQSESDTEFICEEAKEHWDVSSEVVLRDFNEESSSESDNPVQPNNGITTLISMFLLLWASFYGISASALNHLIQFLHYVFSLLSSSSPTIASLLAVFPTSLYTMKKKVNISKDEFEKYVIRSKCCSLYTYEECLQTSVSGQITPKPCNHIAF